MWSWRNVLNPDVTIFETEAGIRLSSSITFAIYRSLSTCAEQTDHFIERPVKVTFNLL